MQYFLTPRRISANFYYIENYLSPTEMLNVIQKVLISDLTCPLSTNKPDLQKYCKTMLSRASNSILSHVLKEVNKDLHRLKKQCKNLKVQLLYNLSGKNYKTAHLAISNKVRYMPKAIRRRHSRKLSWEKLLNITT